MTHISILSKGASGGIGDTADDCMGGAVQRGGRRVIFLFLDASVSVIFNIYRFQQKKILPENKTNNQSILMGESSNWEKQATSLHFTLSKCTRWLRTKVERTLGKALWF